MQGLLKQQFRPEFLNRLDEIVFYKPLTKAEIRSIVELLVQDLGRRLKDKQLTISLTDAAKDFVVDGGYDPIYGARPLKRFLQSQVETMVAKLILRDDPLPGTHITVDCVDGHLTATASREAE